MAAQILGHDITGFPNLLIMALKSSHQHVSLPQNHGRARKIARFAHPGVQPSL
jgi:hypothetical protein